MFKCVCTVASGEMLPPGETGNGSHVWAHTLLHASQDLTALMATIAYAVWSDTTGDPFEKKIKNLGFNARM